MNAAKYSAGDSGGTENPAGNASDILSTRPRRNDSDEPSAPSESSDSTALRQQVISSLREDIISGRLPAGTRLHERDLSARFHVSRVPVREAIITLSGEGLVTVRPRVGAFVAPLTLQDVRELFEIRAAVEPLAARMCALRASDEHRRAFLDLTSAAVEADREADPARGSTANADFHDLLLEAADNRLLLSMSRPVMGMTRRLFRQTIVDHEAMMWADHREIARAISEGDGTRAAALAAEHLDRTSRHSLSLFAAQAEAEPVS